MKKASVCACALVLMIGSAVTADQVVLAPVRDNTLYEDPDGLQSNGIGGHIFAGTTAFGEIRRALLAFDIAASVPAGSTIDAVTLTLNMSRTIVGDEPVSLHRALADWGEAGSDAPGEEGIGALPEPGDATWHHTFYPDQLWAAEGGDFAPAASATAVVGGLGPYDWSSAQMAADVQGWLDDPSGNFGWCLVGNEQTSPTAKRFDSRENPAPELRPALLVAFTPPSQAETICPASPDDFDVVLGGPPITGDALSTCDSDNRRLTVANRTPQPRSLPFVRVDIWAVTGRDPAAVQSLEYRMEGGATAVTGGPQNADTLRTSIRRYRGPNTFVLVDERATAIPFVDEVVTHVQVEDVGDFIANDGEIRIRVEAFDPGRAVNAAWELRVDQFLVTVR